MKQTQAIPETFLGVGYVSDRAGLPLKAKPGEVYEYSNTNYIVLGAIVEKASVISTERVR